MGSYDQYKKEVLETSLWLSDHGYFGSLRGTGGNVSVRIEDRDLMAVTPSSVKYHELAMDDICIVDLTGAVVEGSRAPSVEAGMHAAIYRERPDVKAVVHTHQIYGSVFAVLNQPIPALLDEISFTLGDAIEEVRLSEKRSRPRGCRASVGLERSGLLHGGSLAHDDHRIGHEKCFTLIVGHEHRGHSEPPQHRREVVTEFGTQLRIQRGERLVEQEEIGLGSQGAREGDALSLAT